MGIEDSQWHPFRPTELDLARIANEVAEIRPIQQKMVECNKELRFPERVAHEYQIVGSRVIYQVARELPETLSGIRRTACSR